MTAKARFVCPGCGAKFGSDAAYCAACGEHVAASWSRDVKLVTNRFLAKDMLVVLVVALPIMEVLVAGMSFFIGEDVVWIPPSILGIAFGVVLGLFLFSAGVVLRNRVPMEFLVTPGGVAWSTGRRQKKMTRAALTISLLAGSPTAAGASLLALAQESGRLPWKEVRKVTYFPGPGVITLSNAWRPTLRLYLPTDQYHDVAAMVDRYALRAKQPGPRLLIRWGREAWTRTGFALASVAATALATVWYDLAVDDLWRPLLLAGFLVAIGTVLGGAARRILGFLGTALTLYLFVRHLMEGFDHVTGFTGIDYGRFFSVDSLTFALSVAGYVALLALGARCAVASIKRR
jgi:hypothetical protein